MSKPDEHTPGLPQMPRLWILVLFVPLLVGSLVATGLLRSTRNVGWPQTSVFSVALLARPNVGHERRENLAGDELRAERPEIVDDGSRSVVGVCFFQVEWELLPNFRFSAPVVRSITVTPTVNTGLFSRRTVVTAEAEEVARLFLLDELSPNEGERSTLAQRLVLERLQSSAPYERAIEPFWMGVLLNIGVGAGAVGVGVWLVAAAARVRRRRLWLRLHQCPYCGYAMLANEDRCSECGWRPVAPDAASA